jgi:NAD(P)H-hydrate epimerase
VIPVVTPSEMAAIDRAAPEPVDVLIGRAGARVAREARQLLGGTYGRRVVVVAGKGNNGNDGRDAAQRLRRTGMRVTVIDAAAAAERLPPCDLVIDAAYGTGFRGEYDAPDPGGAPVLAVDIPSGVDGSTGEACAGAVRADRTVTFAALKPGLVFDPGRRLAGDVVVADIGLDVSTASTYVVEAADVAAWLPPRPPDTHKWKSAVWVIAGSPGMSGAAALAARAAQRGGAGYVRLSTPGARPADVRAGLEVVGAELPAGGWAASVLDGLARFKALVIGPGLGEDAVVFDVQQTVANSSVPTVVDGDGLRALCPTPALYTHPFVILTPHDGEYERLTGHAPGADRIAAARELAVATGAITLLKGPTTVVAAPSGAALLATEADARLASAGTGDVLSGLIGALCASGLDPVRAAAAGAFLHGRAGTLGSRRGLVAGDVAELLPAAFDSLES